MTDAEKAEKMLLGDVCRECGEPYENVATGFVGICPDCNSKKLEEINQLIPRKKEETRKHLRSGEMLITDYLDALYGKIREPLQGMFLCEIATVFGWGLITRPLRRKVQQEWWYTSGRKKSRWKLWKFDNAFVQQMVDNLVRCGIFTIEDDIWTFKGFPKGWERKWRRVHHSA